MKLDKKVAYALVGAGSLTIYGIFNTYTLFFYTDVVKLSARWVGLGWFLFSFWNAINDVVGGWISDRSLRKLRTRGKLISVLAVPTAISFSILWNPLSNSIWYFLLVISLFDFFYSLLTINYGAIFPALFVAGRERVRASAINRVVGYGIGGGLTALAPIIYSSIGWGAMGVYLAALAIALYLLGVRRLNENHVSTEETGFVVISQYREVLQNVLFRYVIGIGICLRFVLAVFVTLIPFYTKYVLNLDGSSSSILLLGFIGASLVGLFWWEKFFRKEGTRRAMLLSLGLATAFLIPFTMVNNLQMAVIFLIVIGIVSGGGMLMGPDLLFAEVLDDDYQKTKRRREGVYTGLLGFTFRFPPALVGVILGELLTWARYDANLGPLAQNIRVSEVIKVFFVLGPMFAFVAGLVLLWKYPLRSG